MVKKVTNFPDSVRKVFYLATALFIMAVSFTACIDDTKHDKYNTLNYNAVYPALQYDVFPILPTFLGNFERNYYGDEAPEKLELIQTMHLGSGSTRVGSNTFHWSGAGWTGQPLVFLEDTIVYLVQGTYSHRLLKIKADDMSIDWAYKFDDVLKGTGTLYHNPNADSLDRFSIIQGSRIGFDKNLASDVVKSLRSVNYFTGENLWKYNSKRTRAYTRDVDGSALIHNDTAYIGLENGYFIAFDPKPENADTLQGIFQPKVYEKHLLYEEADITRQGGNLAIESSPAILGDNIYMPTGAGHIYGYNLKTRKINYDFPVATDINGSAVVTDDNCIIVAIEKEYNPGPGGVIKLDPSKPADSSVVWYLPLPDRFFVFWHGGVIGTATVNDRYRTKDDKIPNLAAFSTICGYLYVVDTNELSGDSTYGPRAKHRYPTPKVVFKYNQGPSISTPVFVQNKIVAASYDGVRLFEFDEDLNFTLLDHYQTGSTEATPAVFNRKIYLAGRNGLLHVLGEKEHPINPSRERLYEITNYPAGQWYHFKKAHH